MCIIPILYIVDIYAIIITVRRARETEAPARKEVNTMTNNMIIFWASVELMKEGKLSGTGRMVEIELDDGQRISVEEPEEIHTFAAWKKMGFIVKKGEKATAQINIWKHTVKQLPTDTPSEEVNKANKLINDQGGQENMFRKTASFFTAAQVQPLTA